MKLTISRLQELQRHIQYEKEETLKQTRNEAGATTYEHGSHEQTRVMFIDSLFTQALNAVKLATDQLEIINRELY